MKFTTKTLVIAILVIRSISFCYGQDLTKSQIQLVANNMLISKKYHVNIKKILPSINNVEIVLLDIPYREFPSIIILNKDKVTNKWVRVFECLGPGIQDKRSGLLDWHTVKVGVDFEIDGMKTYDFQNKKVRAMVESSMKVKGTVIIPYQNFIHMHTSDGPNSPAFTRYTIDKTQYRDLANLLFDDRYKDYPSQECTMFDSPAIVDCEFRYENNLYILTATTDTKQIWTYTFDGIDDKNRYLLNKKTTVERF
jgi:hypothetical protein